MLEDIQGENNILVLKIGFLKRLRRNLIEFKP